MIGQKKRAVRQRLAVGDLVEHVNNQHPDYRKIGMVTRLTDKTKMMRIAFVLVDGAEHVWFLGDFVKLRVKDESI